MLASVTFGGPKWMVGGTIFEMWLGVSVILGTAVLPGSSSLFRWAEPALIGWVGAFYQVGFSERVVVPNVPRQAEVVGVVSTADLPCEWRLVVGSALVVVISVVRDCEVGLGHGHPNFLAIAPDAGGNLPVLR